MNNTPVALSKSSPAKQPAPTDPENRAKRPPRATGKKKRIKGPRTKKKPGNTRQLLLFTSLEMVGLVSTALIAIMVLLGYWADRFSGTRFLTSQLPFAFGILALAVSAILFTSLWQRLRRWLLARSLMLPAALALGIALVAGTFVIQGHFFHAFGHFRTLVGGKEEASRRTLAHQVYATYRRHDSSQLQLLIDRSMPYSEDIEQAARAFGLDPDLLLGIAAAESSFLPRPSSDGGQGLFQITRVPEVVMIQAGRHLGVASPSVMDHRHNGFIAAATFKYYLGQMKNDLFLGLLAYNIGPANGGLRFIMQQYGATDFVTIQPYLQTLPRDYPIRVLSYALAFRLYRQEGSLPAYEEGLNAIRIQHIGIPGF
ncbi:lytic transglycosylase domain-containing protein [Desulfobulbus alkaliphilus]|uniref:lytic transglycosylase domain-containing protein n=1 Tax=Desulfobulbus alkaliphilus TaxID=869814 RepID=UPI0019626243|nr:transglycosylase SLT domain-containing protein [Desulfobulbus alkaliphilus]MBM9537790.1 transglycosylase SLT domain-containing protein [Desulfobulbus alkaliphilus]